MNIIICLVGFAWHVAMKWDEHRRTREPLSLGRYIAGPARSQTAVSVLATTAAYLVTSEMDWMNPGMALACGYMGNSIAENLANRFAKPKE